MQNVAALHVEIAHGEVPSVSTAIAALRRLLLDPPHGDGGEWYKKVAEVCAFLSVLPQQTKHAWIVRVLSHSSLRQITRILSRRLFF